MLREIFHITEKKFIPSIKEGGLKTLRQQQEDGIIDLEKKLKRNYRGLGDQNLVNFYINTLYFSLEKPLSDVSWVSLMVEERAENILNNTLEFSGFERYMSSQMKVTEFLLNSNGKTLLHPTKAVPIYESDIKPRGMIPEYELYSPEVIIQRSCIKDFVEIYSGQI